MGAAALTSSGTPMSTKPPGASGTFLRIVMVNDVYRLANYPPLAQLIRLVKASAVRDDCKVISVLNGDFLSPCIETSLDSGKAMGEVLDLVPIDYICFGNHEFDIGAKLLQKRARAFRGKWLNGNITSPEFHGPDGKHLPRFDVLEVGTRKVCLTGVTTDDMDIYRPGNDAKIERPGPAIVNACMQAVKENGAIDAFIPLTHQTIAQDRAMAEELQNLEPSLKGKVPVICGGHEHEVFIEDNAGALIVKVGADAVKAGLIDVWWDEEGKMEVAVQLLPLRFFKPEAQCPCDAYVRRQAEMIEGVLGAEILRLDTAMSTARVRYEPSELAAQLLLRVKKALAGVEIAMVQAGTIRGKAQYAPGPFTFGDLMREFPFDSEMAIIDLPGKIIAESMKNTRGSPEKEMSSFLHADAECVFDKEDRSTLTQIDGRPLELDRLYKVAIRQFLLQGLDNIEPLMTYVRASVQVPELERCLPAKNLVLEICMQGLWKRILGGSTDLQAVFSAWDADKNGRLSKEEIHAQLVRINGDGDDSNDVSVSLISEMIKALDADDDGKISFNEFEALAQL